MKTVSTDLKNALKKSTTQRKGRILVNENYYEVYNVQYYADAYNDGNVIGNAIASQLDFDLPYIEKFDNFKYFDGVWTGIDYEYVDMGTFHVFDEQDEDEFNKHITAFDNLIKFNVPFQEIGIYPKTLYQELVNVCNQAGVFLENASITNGNFEVVNNQFVNGENLKAVLKSICSISGTYAIIKNDKLVLQLKNQTDEILEKNQHEPVLWKRQTYGINQVVLGMADISGEYVLREDAEDIAINGVHKLVINDNLFAYTQEKRNQLIDELFNQVRGFGYIPYEVNCEWLNYLEIGDTITIDNIETIVLRINGKSPKALESNISAPAIIDSSIEYINNTDTIENRMKRTEISVDKQNQTIESVVEQTDEQNQKINRVVQTVDELNSKISDIADITISAEDTDGKVELNNINQSEPIRIVVRPIGESISYLYPHNNLFPSDTLYLKNRKIRFENTKTSEIFDYELPADLLYYNSEIYDEFILDYDSQTCIINKMLDYNEDGSIYVLPNIRTLEFEYPRILLTDGDYEISVLSYDTAYLFVRLMAQNIYTTQFATRAELSTEIQQTNQEINLIAIQKVGNNEIISRINQSAEEITIEANKINMNGVVQLINEGTTTINGNKITTGSITSDKVSSDIITTNNFSSQNINANNITSGIISTERLETKVITTDNISAQKISANNIEGGTISASNINLNGVSLGTSSSTIGGFITSNEGFENANFAVRTNGTMVLYPQIDGGATYRLNNGLRLNASAGVVISSNGGVTSNFPTTNLDLKACSGAVAYLACMRNADGTEERSGVSCADGVLNLRSSGVIYANGSAIGGSSSKNTKTNIIELSQKKKDELYKLIKNVPFYEYDYKPQYGKEKNYGFLIEDIEKTKLNDLLHIVKINDDIKTYCSEDLTRLNLIIIKELMNKIEILENKIKELESEKNGI